MIRVGLLHSRSSTAGKVAASCILMALSDFYDVHDHYRTKLWLQFRDQEDDIVDAASA
ncbi:hypothetical protein NL676_034515, partial [Syzygium grande]